MSDKKEFNAKNFFNKANLIFNNKFDYSLFEYKNAKTKSFIKCPNHGIFEQTPDKHISKNSKGCPKCWKEINAKRILKIRKPKKIKDKDVFLKKAVGKFKNKFEYDLSNYNGFTKNKIKINCKNHGWFESYPRLHLISENGCPTCGKENSKDIMTKSYDFFIEQANKVHNNKYFYPGKNVEKYKNKKSTVEIFCEKHGYFLKKAQKHISGQGCFKCKIEELVNENVLVGGFCEDLFEDNPSLKTKEAMLYYLKINDGEFYKIGITTTKLNNRIKGLKSKAKSFGEEINIEIINTKKIDLYDAFIFEQNILKKNKEKRVYKKWSTELFNVDINEKIFEYFI